MSPGNPMVVFFLVLGSLALLCCMAGALVTAKSGRRLGSPGFLLLSTALLSVAVFGLTSGWLLHSDTRSGPGDAVRTGGLAAAAVLALYGLWLNDRRRRTEEERNDTERKRHDIEAQRNAQERERTAGERFARAIELLGNPDASVKLGALHSLASLAVAWPDLVQPVLDVLCGYLRMPFDPVGFGPEGDETAWRAGQVRRTAQRLVRQTLQDVAGCRPAGPGYRLDLDGAVLYEFSMERVAVETISADRVECHGRTVLDGLTVSTLLSLRDARFHGKVSARDCRVADLAAHRARFDQQVDLSDAIVITSDAGQLRFTGGLIARRLRCSGEIRWYGDFLELADFTGAMFDRGLDFSGSALTGSASFADAVLGAGTNFDNVAFDSLDLRARSLPHDFDPQRLLVRCAEKSFLPEPLWLEPAGTRGTYRVRRR